MRPWGSTPGCESSSRIHREDIEKPARPDGAAARGAVRFLVFWRRTFSFDAQIPPIIVEAVLEGASKAPRQCHSLRHLQPAHLLSRDMDRDERSARSSGEAVEEKGSLSDRFG